MTSIVLTAVLFITIVIFLMNKSRQRQELEPIPVLDTLQDKQMYLRNLSQRSHLNSNEWMVVLLSYFILDKLVEIESVQQAQELVQKLSQEDQNAYINEMMENEDFLDQIIFDLPEELAALPSDISNSNEDTSVNADVFGGDGGSSSSSSSGD